MFIKTIKDYTCKNNSITYYAKDKTCFREVTDERGKELVEKGFASKFTFESQAPNENNTENPDNSTKEIKSKAKK